ncbi:MAG: DeoR/GlpR family DNA-binding transcription regulator [Eubacteriaceae bacterium]|jgi:DeoR family fructose operon transcriptional repressor|nr:DeoR/GlpR family DNA-binding transcription regulator [Eubacteriaceae bacterium]
MLQNVRYNKILEQIQRQNSVRVTDLAEELGVSESTIRRDINDLDKAGQLRKVFGGAVANRSDIIGLESDVMTRETLNVEEKNAIARYAASIINDDDFIFIDAGTTTARIVDFLESKKATIVTNGVPLAMKLIQSGFRSYMIGGELKLSTEAVVGTDAVESLKKYNFTKCFIGTNGIDTERGYTTPDIDESMVKTTVINQSYVSYILADHSKFGLITSVSFADIREACIITDHVTDKKYIKHTIVKEVGK